MEKISGVVENLRIEKGYQDLIFTKTDSQVAGVAAIGAAAVGQVASATVLNNASAGAEVGMDFFACTVNGMSLRGAFHKVEFVNGDQIEFVIEPESDFLPCMPPEVQPCACCGCRSIRYAASTHKKLAISDGALCILCWAWG